MVGILPVTVTESVAELEAYALVPRKTALYE